VKSSANLAFAALLAASLGGKLLASRPAAKVDRAGFARQAASFLRASGYAVEVGRIPINPLIYGTRAGCRLMIGDYDPHGTMANVFDRAARPVGPLHFYYRGVAYGSAPKLRPLTEYYVRRELVQIGRPVARRPVLAVAASPGCDLAALDWSQLATLPR
jgi:hypothetical protein